MARRIKLRSPLDPIALATRLKERVPAVIDDKTVAQVIGRGSEQTMTLWYYRPRLKNDLATRLVADIAPDGSGSVIEGTIGAPTSGLAFIGCWSLFVLGFAIFGIWMRFVIRIDTPFLLIPLAMLVFGIGFTWLTLRHGKRDAAAIRAFLAQTIDAR